MDCFQDFCLHCDRDSPDGPYCSQHCKLADLERSNPSSPTSTASQSGRFWTQSASLSSSRPQSSYLAWSQSDKQMMDARQLTPSSSRTSLSSASSRTTTTTTTTTSGSYSTEAKAQLNDYFSSFDQAKAAKRRSSTR
ncbi:uncharacterized protein SEPMUDRAFT_152152 [Sphaerulina musiva SO2202]|uniref:Uncharacterized protein n=1 Tax=Sphaerulina musiva (strain SO2202) TaxID=692275 RepID=M3CXV8_SPHMS|nr:uncharacterized protein SEPMUDRAFT_152152 [Sphaerulina musiva SO2202]EMF08506.1 hypothetical protein SEPMUDRAFT_152152 [Sphaerulina musiva SO2202]